MVQAQDPRTGEKRGPGRPPKNAQLPVAKRLRTSIPASPSYSSPTNRSPVVDSPAPERRAPKLPSKVSENKPLPTLLEPQSLTLSNNEYQGIAASAVLAAALERSRTRWTSDGVFQRYWVKPQGTGKNAKQPPLNNPDVKWMKPKGECRIRLEPHVFTADVFVEERPKIPQPPKQYNAGYGQQYKPPPVVPQPVQPHQNRMLQPGNFPGTPQPVQTGGHNTPIQSSQQGRPRPSPSPTPTQQSGQKASSDPVISMLASRASSDPELKGLMKEVATGNATQDQLRVFQRHIDELTDIIKTQKKDEEQRVSKVPQESNSIQYDGPGEGSSQPTPVPVPAPIQQRPPPQPSPYQALPPPPPLYQPPAPVWTPPPTNLPLILAFKDPGASEDRFLFPQMSILETLSPQHELVSFIVVKKGHDAADSAGLQTDREYWQPVTMMIEVAYGREDILNFIRKWVRPAAEVRKHMENVMQRCQRAPPSHLAMQLPLKGSKEVDSEEVSKEATPIVEEKSRKHVAKSTKRLTSGSSTPLPSKSTVNKVGNTSSTPKTAVTTSVGSTAGISTQKKDIATPAKPDGASDQPDTTESGRPRRALRKSVRISEG